MQAGIASLGARALNLFFDTAMSSQLRQLSSPMPHVWHAKLNSAFTVACHAADIPFYTALPSLGPCLRFCKIIEDINFEKKACREGLQVKYMP
jgi:hypothetical protein